MSLPAKTAQSADPQPAKTNTGTTTTATPVVQDTRSYLVMMLLAVFVMPTGLARAYRGEQIGWIRFWVFIGSYVSMLVPMLGLVGGLAIIVLVIWGLIDIFLLRGTKTDAAGKPLTSTPTDNKWANGFFIYAVVSLALVTLVTILAIGFFSMYYASCNNDPSSCRLNPPYNFNNNSRSTMPYEINNNESF